MEFCHVCFQVLCTYASKSDKLSQEEVWTHQSVKTKEEIEVVPQTCKGVLLVDFVLRLLSIWNWISDSVMVPFPK